MSVETIKETEFDRLSHCHSAVFVESQSYACSNNVGRGPFGQHQEPLNPIFRACVEFSFRILCQSDLLNLMGSP